MKIKLRTEPEIIANNITVADSKTFADIVRVVEAVDDQRKLVGTFKLYKQNDGSVYLELEMKERR